MSIDQDGELKDSERRTLPAAASQMLEVITETRLRVITFDMEIAADHLKYSTWSAALATAGVAVIITKRGDITSTFFIGAFVRWSIVIAGLTLVLAVAAAAYIHWKVNRLLDAERHIMTLALKQRVRVMGGALTRDYDDPSRRDLLVFGDAILDHEYLNADDKEKLDEYLRKAFDPEKLERPLFLQSVLTASGYAILLLIAV